MFREFFYFIHQTTVILLHYWITLSQYIILDEDYSNKNHFYEDDKHAKVHLFSIALMIKLWNQKHYRSKSYQQDLLDNLKNVAIPGTGIPLSIFCYHRFLAIVFIYVFSPVICLLGAFYQIKTLHHSCVINMQEQDPNISEWKQFFTSVKKQFVHNLLHSNDWFTLWRTNCNLVAYHSHVTKSSEYNMEDKWTFLVQGKSMNVPVSPFNDTMESIVCKNKLIEGGMGIHFYKNAAFDGDWIIQERLHNAPWLRELLPSNAPLSTMRIITTSTFSLSEEYPIQKNVSVVTATTMLTNQLDDEEEESGLSNSLNGSSNSLSNLNNGLGKVFTQISPIRESSLRCRNASLNESNHTIDQEFLNQSNGSISSESEQIQKYIRAESAVLRLGRMNAATDHSSILFDVDISTGTIKGGTTNAHWYQLGLAKAMNAPWLPPYDNIQTHLDAPNPQIYGKVVPDMKEAVEIVTR